MDRTGKRRHVMVRLRDPNGNDSLRPAAKYLEITLDGSRHWSLPAGWIAGLEKHLQTP